MIHSAEACPTFVKPCSATSSQYLCAAFVPLSILKNESPADSHGQVPTFDF
jgi:hypothetical protein